jgi:hypothetical protein
MSTSYQVIRPDPSWVTAAEITADYTILRRWLGRVGGSTNGLIVTGTNGGLVEAVVLVNDGFVPSQDVVDVSGTIEDAHAYIRANW